MLGFVMLGILLQIPANILQNVGSIDLTRIVYEILKVTPSGNFQADFLNLLFFPHVVLVLFLFMLADVTTMRHKHAGISALLSLAVYIFIVYYGFYAVIASLSVLWLAATILITFGYFFLGKLIHPIKSTAGYLAAKSFGAGGVNKAIDLLREDKTDLQRDLTNARRELQRADTEQDEHRRAEIEDRIGDIQKEMREVDKKIRELEQQKRVL